MPTKRKVCWVFNKKSLYLYIKFRINFLKIYILDWKFQEIIFENILIVPHIICLILVAPAWEEPLPGWVDSLNGPIGILVGGAKGVIRTMLCDGQFRAEAIPVDLAINGLIGIAWKVGTMKEKYAHYLWKIWSLCNYETFSPII